MRIHLLSVGNRMPHWVDAGFQEYAKRLPHECALRLQEIAPSRRGKHPDLERIRHDEGKRMLAALPKHARVVALDERGQSWSSAQLSRQLGQWLGDGRDIALLVGGADGLAPTCLQRAEVAWSLSPLTLPHPLVRVLVAEQLYRAWSLLRGHPYHRA